MQKNYPLIIGIALPVIFIVIISLIVFLPSFAVKPEHNFLYSNDRADYYGYGYNQFENKYELDSRGKVIEVANPQPDTKNEYTPTSRGKFPTLYLYDVKANTTKQVTLADVRDLVFTKGPSSPDGYTVTYEYNNDGIFELFGGSNNRGYVITKGKGKKPLTGLNVDRYGSQSLNLIGWVN